MKRRRQEDNKVRKRKGWYDIALLYRSNHSSSISLFIFPIFVPRPSSIYLFGVSIYLSIYLSSIKQSRRKDIGLVTKKEHKVIKAANQ